MTPQQLAKSGTEHGHQRAFFSELHRIAPDIADMAFAIPNGGGRASKGDKRTARIRGATLKAEGVKEGVPDIFIAQPFSSYHGLFIEMKRPEDKGKDRRKGVTSTPQDDWHAKLVARGYAVAIAYSWEEAITLVATYFGVKLSASQQETA